MADIAAMMESARSISKGTMPVWVRFDTEADVEEARAWMKGKKNVKLLTPMTHAEADARCARRKAEIERAVLGGKKN